MKAVPRFLQVMLMVCLAATSVAQAGNETESAAGKEKQEKQAEQVQALMVSLDQGFNDLRALTGQIDTVAELDREAVLFRIDERSFRLLQELDKLARQVAQLPVDDPARVEAERRLRDDMARAGNAVSSRVIDLGKRIATYRSELESLSGERRVGVEAYVNGLENQRIQYYQATVDLIDARKALDMPVDQVMPVLQQRLYLHAETLVGRVEFLGAAFEEVEERLQGDPQNAELAAAAKTLANKHQLYLQQLGVIADLLASLEVDNAAYKAVLLQQSEGFSVRDLQGAAVMDLLRGGWAALRSSLEEQAPDLVFNFLVFILIVLVFRVLSRLIRRAVVAACERPGVELSTLLKDILASVTSGTVMVFGILIALSQIGISLGPMLAGLGVAGFVVGFALQDTLSNFAAGGMILIYRPYDVDDFVEVTGASGLVKKMNLVSTTITTFDNQTLVVPNSKIWGDVIKNVTAQKLRRVDLEFGIGYGDDIEHAERVLEEIVSNHEMVLKKPETMIKLHTLGESSVNFVVRPWVKTEDYWDVYWDITREVKMRFDREGISIPFPQRDVHLYSEQA